MSWFGRGYAYCLGLFLAHAERCNVAGELSAGMALYGAADHIFDLEIPSMLPENDQLKIKTFKDMVMELRLDEVSMDQWHSLLQTAKDLLLEWDAFCGIPCEKGDYE